ncbi:MAG: YncE family protein [Odoribacteraceae bacterium]|jgi:DNA-binding beta-propeller fold protein YncE|nr:YncE family protein [Odoribacteraceae bacterium]
MIMNRLFWIGAMLLAVAACRSEDDPALPPTVTPVAPGESGAVKGFFLLNEANMGSNKASLDYFDYESGEYHKNIFPRRNPGVVQELGDVGNDIQIRGSKLYAVINCSHLVEVMDAGSATHLAAISIPNCRYIAFHEGYAYVSSYAGPVQIDPNARLGYVAKVDTASLAVVDTCVVGYQPEEMVVRDGKLYVANSGGYRVPDYDNTVSVIDLATFTETKKITVAINLHRLELDAHGNIYVTSRGDYKNTRSNTYIIDANDMVSDNLHLAASNMTIAGDSLYLYGTEWRQAAGAYSVTYAIVNTRTKRVVSRSFITDGTEKRIEMPYGVAVNPETREIFVADAKDYITPGTLFCFAPDGKLKWEVTTGDIPAHVVFTRKRLSNL